MKKSLSRSPEGGLSKMKLWYSFTKELKLSSKSWYFYIELGMAIVFLVILLFVVPENFSSKTSEYIYLDMPEPMVTGFMTQTQPLDLDQKSERIEVEVGKDSFMATVFETEDKKVFFMDDKAAIAAIADKERKFSAIISADEEGQLSYEYFLQGYESERFKNLYLILHNKKATTMDLMQGIENQRVEKLQESPVGLNDRENMIPIFLTFNGSFMGMFIIAAYIFLDKQEGIIKAYAVTASTVWQYLLSKVGVIVVTSIATSLIIMTPVMGLQPNYFLFFVFLITSGFFATSIGLVLSSYYRDITQSFGALFLVIIAMMLPNISYLIPSWEPLWMKFIPTYYMIQSFKEIILPNSDAAFVLLSSLGFLVLGVLLFLFANHRFKKTLTV